MILDHIEYEDPKLRQANQLLKEWFDEMMLLHKRVGVPPPLYLKQLLKEWQMILVHLANTQRLMMELKK